MGDEECKKLLGPNSTEASAILATLTDCEENIEEKCGLPLTRNRTKSHVIETCSSASTKFIEEFDACTTKQMTKAERCKCVDGISAKYIEIITGCDISRQKLAALKLKNKCKS